MAGVSMAMAMPAAGGNSVGALAGFAATWTGMMAAMMLPSLVPALRRFHRMALRPGRLTTIAVSAYLLVWAAAGALAYAAELAAARGSVALPARMRGMAVGMIVVVAAGVQFTRWKARHLACCREPRVTRAASASAAGAWGFGVRLGWHCLNSSAALTVALLAVGMMDLRTMAAATGAITAERLTPPHARVTWIVGGIGGCIGIALAARAALA